MKDVLDQLRINRGGNAIAWNDIEHNPSNIVILLFLITGLIAPEGTTFGLSNRLLAYSIAAVDLLLDGYQD